MAEENAPIKIPKQPSSPNGITWYQNGQKFTIPLQGGIFAGVLALVFKVWVVFNTMQVDVNQAKTSLDQMAQSIQGMEQTSQLAIETAKSNKSAIEAAAKHDAEVDEAQEKLHENIDQRLKALELCHSKPKSCEL